MSNDGWPRRATPTVGPSCSLHLRRAGGGWEDGVPVVFHVGQFPTVSSGLVQGCVELSTEHVLTIVGKLALAVGVMDDQTKRRSAVAATDRRPDQHLAIAVRVAKAGDRPAPDVLINIDGLAGFVVEE